MKNKKNKEEAYLIGVKKSISLMLFLFVVTTGSIHAQFVHPGLAHKESDLDRMKYMVEAGLEPWKSSFEAMQSNSDASYDYNINGPQEGTSYTKTSLGAMQKDAQAAYYNALSWYITGDTRYADKAIEVFSAWSTIRNVSGVIPLNSGKPLWRMLEAAEIIKSTYSGWSQSDINAFKEMLVYPGWSGTTVPSGQTSFYWSIYNGDPARHGNQGLFAFRSVMAMGVFMDNEVIYNRALLYLQGEKHASNDLPYPSGPPITVASPSTSNEFYDEFSITSFDDSIEDYGYNELIENYIWETGQGQEASRDQAHSVGGISIISTMCEMAWNQGFDLYSFLDNRVLKGLEYTYRYNLSYEYTYPDQTTPWEPTVASGEFIERTDRSGRWKSLKINPYTGGNLTEADLTRGKQNDIPLPQMILGHYKNRINLDDDEVKWVSRGDDVAFQLRGYEGAGTYTDHPSYGHLAYHRIDGSPGDPINGFDSNNLPEYSMNVLPITIEAENFDYFVLNGQDRTYNDLTNSNDGDQYRIDENVDIESLTGGGYNLTSIENGEWLTYTVSVPSNGTYDIDINYAAANGNGAIKFSFNGADTTSDVAIPFGAPNSTGLTDWQDFKVANAVRLSKGVQSLKILFNGTDDAFKLNNFTVSLVEADPEETVLIQAEDYSAMSGIQTQETGDVGGGDNVGYIDANDWMEYDVDIVNSGTFILNYRVASKNGGGSVEFLVDGVSQGSTNINIADGWQTYTTLSTTVSLSSGSHTIRLNALSGGWNINWLELVLDEVELLSQEEFDKNNVIRIYPNPVSNHLTVLMPISKFSEYTIFDISGRVNKQGVIASNMQKLNIDLSNFSKGVYLISLKGNQLTKTFKLIKN
ncbi:MAG: carbohydrate-binding protein [Algibacter sp.]